MVEHDIKNDFDTRFMCALIASRNSSSAVSGEQAYAGCSAKHRHRVVTPVVTKPHTLQTWFTGKLCHRRRFQRGNAQLFQIVDHHRMPQGFISATDLDRDLRAGTLIL